MINELKIWEGMTSDIETVLQIAKSPDNWFYEDGIKYIEQDLEFELIMVDAESPARCQIISGDMCYKIFFTGF